MADKKKNKTFPKKPHKGGFAKVQNTASDGAGNSSKMHPDHDRRASVKEKMAQKDMKRGNKTKRAPRTKRK